MLYHIAEFISAISHCRMSLLYPTVEFISAISQNVTDVPYCYDCRIPSLLLWNIYSTVLLNTDIDNWVPICQCFALYPRSLLRWQGSSGDQAQLFGDGCSLDALSALLPCCKFSSTRIACSRLTGQTNLCILFLLGRLMFSIWSL